MMVADELGADAPTLRGVGLGALLHDIGKIAIDDAILKKPGKLSDAEFAVMREHATLGYEIVLSSLAVGDAALGVRHHHERFDGNGYPDRLIGDLIPFAARVISVCDAFDAIANTRQYRNGAGEDHALEVINEFAGSQWDPSCAAALQNVVRRLPRRDVFAAVGRSTLACDCLDATEFAPDDAGREAATAA